MKHRWATPAALVASVILQVMLGPHLAIAGIVPNLPLLVVITLALVRGPSSGAISGFAAGLALDLLGAAPVGAWALVLSIVGYSAGLLQANVFAEGWLLPVTVAAVAGLLADSAYLVVLTVLGSAPDLGPALVAVVVPGAVYNTVLILLVYPWLARFLRSDRSVRSFRRLA